MKKIMFVEDDPVLMEAYVLKFQEEKDWGLLQARDGNQAIEIMDRIQPDLLVTGITLPNIDGFGVLQHVKNKGYKFPVLVLTNHDSEEERAKALSLRAEEYMLKSDMTFAKMRSVFQQYL